MRRCMAIVFAIVAFGCVAIGAEAVSENVNAWAPVFGELAQMALQIFAPIITMLISWAVWKLAGKLGIEKNMAMDELLNKYVKEGVNWADAWAKAQADKPSGDQKYAEAVKHILGLVKASPLPTVAEARLRALVEAKLMEEQKVSQSVING
jgi:hypothetical protein